jgi:hypothetical protein
MLYMPAQKHCIHKQLRWVTSKQLTVYGPQVSHDFLLSHFLLQGLDAGGK